MRSGNITPANYFGDGKFYAVNTMQPTSPPFGGGSKLPLIDDAVYPNIGDRLTEAKISWNWYSGGWSDADAGHPGPLFQYHHQPLNYFAAYAPGQPGRSHVWFRWFNEIPVIVLLAVIVLVVLKPF